MQFTMKLLFTRLKFKMSKFGIKAISLHVVLYERETDL